MLPKAFLSALLLLLLSLHLCLALSLPNNRRTTAAATVKRHNHDKGLPYAEWEEVEPTGTPPKERFYPAEDAAGAEWTIAGGDYHDTSEILKDVWTFNFETHTWTERQVNGPTAPPTNSWRPGIASEDGASFYVWGGSGSLTVNGNTLYHFNHSTGEWTALEGTLPDSPSGYTSTFDPEGNLWMFGGTLDRSAAIDTMRYYSFVSKKWTEHQPVDEEAEWPLPRFFHSAVRRGSEWWIFGGAGYLFAGFQFNDLWRFSFETKAWHMVPAAHDYAPPPRALHAAVITPDEEFMFVYGGIHGGYSMDDLWMFHFGPRTWAHIPTGHWDTHAGRDGHAMQLWEDHVSKTTWLYVFGGDHTQPEGPIQKNDVHRAALDHLFNVSWPSAEPHTSDDDDDEPEFHGGLRVAFALGWFFAVLFMIGFVVVLALLIRLRKTVNKTTYAVHDEGL
ncbi:Kelch motif [Balamuthia mandrillaris]